MKQTLTLLLQSALASVVILWFLLPHCADHRLVQAFLYVILGSFWTAAGLSILSYLLDRRRDWRYKISIDDHRLPSGRGGPDSL